MMQDGKHTLSLNKSVKTCIVSWQMPKYLSKVLVLKIHAWQIERFGGMPGIRGEGLLSAVLAQPQLTFS